MPDQITVETALRFILRQESLLVVDYERTLNVHWSQLWMQKVSPNSDETERRWNRAKSLLHLVWPKLEATLPPTHIYTRA
jgi:hypothetical protein